MKVETVYRSFDGKIFSNEIDCKNHEKYQEDLAKRMNDAMNFDSAKLEKLISDLNNARHQAYDFAKNGFIDTIGSPQGRALKYMTSVCKKFVEENKSSLEWY